MSAHRSKPTVPEVLPLVRALYRRHSAGCCLHVVMDDCNVGHAVMASVLASALDVGHGDCVRLARLLAQMSPSQRRRLAAHDKGPGAEAPEPSPFSPVSD